MTEKYTIETKNLGNGKVDSRCYIEIAGKPKTRSEADPRNGLISIYRKFYTNIIKAHTQIIKQENLEKVITTFKI